MIKSLLKHILPDIHQRFEALEVEVEIIIAEWVFSLFSAVIPLKLQVYCRFYLRLSFISRSSMKDGNSFINYA